jgi:predicted nucleic acid-binding protein
VSVFVDTSALYALLVRTEAGHAEVSAAFGELLADGRPLVTTNYVLLESVALLQYRLGLEPVRDLEASLVPLMTQRWIGESLHRRAVERLLRTDRKKLSLVDCTSFVVMEDEGIREALALDHDFVSEGFSLIPGP